MASYPYPIARLELTQAADELGNALLADMDAQSAHLWASQRETKDKETLCGRRWPSKFSFHLWDLGTVAAQLAARSDNATVRDAAQQVGMALRPGGAVISEGHRGDWFEGIGGVSVYAVPPGVQRISPYYSEVALANDTCWGEMLQAYHRVLS